MFGLVFFIYLSESFAEGESCSYSTYQWNTLEKRALGFREVSKPYDQLAANEIDRDTGCSICREDQVVINLPNAPKLKVCRHVAREIEEALRASMEQGLVINTLTGYRVGKTKGAVDQFGNRTQYSHHSFGVAVDVNSEHNGLYDNCIKFNPTCRLIKGGPWSEGSEFSIQRGSPLVLEMTGFGFKWGGEILGKQKDFMHFSISGY